VCETGLKFAVNTSICFIKNYVFFLESYNVSRIQCAQVNFLILQQPLINKDYMEFLMEVYIFLNIKFRLTVVPKHVLAAANTPRMHILQHMTLRYPK
jgi:hypothetical protein